MRRVIVRRFISSAILFAVLFQSFSVTGIAYANAKSDEKSYSENIPKQLMNDEKLNDFGDIDQSSKSRDISETVSCEVYKEGSISGSEKNSNADIGKEADNNKEVLVTPNTNEIDEENKVAKDVTKKPKETKKDIIVVYKDINKAKQTKDKFSSKNNREVKTKYKSKRFKMEALEISDQKNIEEVIIELTSDPNIEYVQPNYRLDSFIIPDDEHFDKQWGLLNNGQIVNGGSGVSGIDINITDAWDITTGDDNVIVAVIDTGVDISHSDLSNSIFSNINEVTNGIDDDGNGLVDDISGWDFVNNDSSVYDGPTKDVHGTGVSGIIAAGLNDTGVVGTSPDVRILPVKFIDGNSGYTSDAIKAIEYAVDMGAGIINCSWGGSEFNPALKDVISKSNALFICAAGNASTNNNQNPVYPASFELDNIISVAAVGSDGNLATFSNYGENVDIAAPGTNILCTTPLERYDYMSGTSMAAPFVAGAAALIKSSDTNLSVSEIKARILNNVTELDSLSGKVNTSGILNTYASLLNETPPCEEPEPEPEEEEEEEVQNDSIEPWFIYDTSVEGNNKIPKPIISEKKLFVDAVDKQETSNVILSGNEEIENLNIYRVKENYVSVTWATYTEASTELCFGGAETLGQELKVDELTTKHQIMVMADENMNYYKVKSVTPSGETFESEVRSVAEDIIDLGGNAPQSFTETSPVNNNHILQDVSLLSYVYDNNDNHTIDTAQAIGECS
ncbi:MAG: S8 family serine peptidase, partial [Clostridium sp.]|nr:S8 family serine peptidase [Clostridium sp.]